jgi:hypothetical protein
MTTLSAYLLIEEPDLTEPASFYVPGVEKWTNTLWGIQNRQRKQDRNEYPEPPWFEIDE